MARVECGSGVAVLGRRELFPPGHHATHDRQQRKARADGGMAVPPPTSTANAPKTKSAAKAVAKAKSSSSKKRDEIMRRVRSKTEKLRQQRVSKALDYNAQDPRQGIAPQ